MGTGCMEGPIAACISHLIDGRSSHEVAMKRGILQLRRTGLVQAHKSGRVTDQFGGEMVQVHMKC